MDPTRFYVIREERVTVRKHRPLEDPIKFVVMEPSADHGKQHMQLPNISDLRTCQRPPLATEVRYQQPPPAATHKVHYQQQLPAFPYSDHNYYQAIQAPPPAKKPTVIGCNEAAKRYGGIVIKEFGRRDDKLPPAPRALSQFNY